MVRRQLASFFGVHHWQPGLSPYDLRHQAAVARVDMLHDDDDRSELRGKATKNLAQGADAAGRGGDGDYVKGGFGSKQDVQSGLRPRPPCISATRSFQ